MVHDVLCPRVQSPLDQSRVQASNANYWTRPTRSDGSDRVVHLGVADIPMFAINNDILHGC
jgi:hypothetical protein